VKHNAAIIKSFNSRGVHRLSEILKDVRVSEKCPAWMSNTVWKELVEKWGSEAFKKKCAQNTSNRNSEKGASCHTGGSISIANHKERMVFY
jgi:hypothetical protein